MGEADGQEPMRWDEQARGGAGGWVRGAAGSPPPPPDDGGPRPPLPTKVILMAVGGGVAIAALVLALSSFFGSSDTDDPVAASGTSSPPAPSTTTSAAEQDPVRTAASGAEQAAAVDALLDRSRTDRSTVIAAVGKVESCASAASVASAGKALDAAASRRDDLIARLDELSLDEIPSGREAADSLRVAWRHSADADRAFAAWADDAAGCTPGQVARGPSHTRGADSSALATAAKEDFLLVWAGIAEQYGLPARDATRI
ncbi:hypothetical protein ABZV68_24890 [Streptomyces clavifer]|uniref:hypothetical protein n=1 Tax=Streptomyces TaxID=1883 RepID=UPI000F54D479|nr:MULTISPECIES: hypothetical protein [unclassified Streptomyces]MDX3067258.1 hypothetical protein [Streptomyces sp. ND04-05B]